MAPHPPHAHGSDAERVDPAELLARLGRRARRIRAARTLSRVSLGVLAAALALGGGFTGWISTGGGSRWLGHQLVRRVSALTDGGELAIGALALGRNGVRIDDVALRDAGGQVLLGAGRITADWDLWALAAGQVHLKNAEVDGLIVDLTRDDAGVFDVVRLFGGPHPDGAPFSLPVDLNLPKVAVHGGSVRVRSPRGTIVEVAGIDGALALTGEGDTFAFTDVALVGQLAVPGPLALRANGAVAWDASEGLALDGVSVTLPHGQASATGTLGTHTSLGATIDRLEGWVVDPLIGDVGLGGVWAGSLSARGDHGKVQLTGGFRGIERSDGAFTADGTIDTTGATPRWNGMAELASFHVEHLVSSVERPVVVSGVIEAEGAGARLQDVEATGRWTGGAQTLYGTDVDRVAAAFGLSRGTLSLRQAELDGVVGDLVLDGTVDLVDGPVDIAVDGSLSGERLAALGTAGLDGDGVIAATITTNWKEQTPIAVDGTARYAPFVYGQDVVARQLVAPFSAKVVGGRITGEVGVNGVDVLALGVHADRVDASGLQFVNEAGRTTVRGPVAIERAVYGADWVSAEHAAVEVLFSTGEGHRVVDARVGLVDYALAGRPGDQGVVVASIRDDDLRYRVDLADFGRPVLATSGSYDLASAEVVLDQVVYSPTPRATWTSRGPGHMRVVDGGVADAELVLDSDLGSVEVHGALGAEGALDGRVAVEGFQLDHLAELYPDRWGGLSGTLDAAFALSGAASDPTIDGAVGVRGLFVDGSVRWLDATGPVHLEHHVLSPDLTLAVAGAPLGRLWGEVPTTGSIADTALDGDAAADVSLAFVPGGLDRLAQLSPSLDGQTVPHGRFSAKVTATGGLRDPTLRLAGVSELAVDGWTTPGRVEFDVERRASELSFDADLRQGLADRATIKGDGKTRLGEITRYFVDGGEAPAMDDLELYLSDMTIATALVGVPASSLVSLMVDQDHALGGDVVGGVTVTGSPVHPIIDGAVNWLDPTLDGQALQGAYLALQPIEGPTPAYDLDVAVSFADDGAFAVNGTIPARIDTGTEAEGWFSGGEMSLDVTSAGIPLALASVVDPRLRDGRGLLALSGRIGGTPFAPEPAVAASIDGGRLSYSELGITAEDIDVRVELDEGLIRLDHADFALIPSHRFQTSGFAESERPRVHAAGSARLDGTTPTALTAKVTLSDAPWIAATEDVTLRTQGEIFVSGAWPKLEATGALDLVYGKVDIDASRFFDDTPLRVDPHLTIVRGETPPAPQPPPAPPAYAEFAVDIDVDLKRNLELSLSMPFFDELGGVGAALSRADVATRLGGKLEVAMRDQEPTLLGTLDVVDGKVRLLRSSLDLEEGTISFVGGDPYADAILDLSAKMPVTGGDLEVAITGTPSEPVVQPHSEAYPDQAEQWTILLTGQAPEELTSDQAQATEAIASVLVNSLLAGRSLGTLSIEPDGSVKVGVPLAPTVFASSSLTTTAAPNENAITLELEWSIAPRVVATAGFGNRIQWGDLYWELRF